MNIKEIKNGQQVKNFYGIVLTVCEVIDGLMIRTYEEINDLYHYTKLSVNCELIIKD